MPRMGNFRNFVFSAIIFGLATALAAAGPPLVRPADPPALSRLVADAGIPRTVGIACTVEKQQDFYGTGAVITPDGYVITSTTVVPAGADNIKIFFDGPKVLKAKIVESNKQLEATLLKVDAKDLPSFPVARDMPAVGQRAFTFSNANDMVQSGSRVSFSMGVISGVYELQDLGGESGYHGPAIETSAAVNPGSDGGPIVNQFGQLCGILSLNSSPLRWQGTGVPIMHVLEQFQVMKAGKLKLSFDPLVATPVSDDIESLAATAREVSDCLVGITVQRKFPVEVLPRMSWDNYRQQIKDWDKLSAAEKLQREDTYTEVERLLEANQILRRPSAALTGLLVSSDGHILTSAFNLGDDLVFKDKTSGKPPVLDFRGIEAGLAKDAANRLAMDKNPIEKILVTLPDGSQREAKLLARHEPLGVVLLKIDAKGLKCCDLTKSAATAGTGYTCGAGGLHGWKARPPHAQPGDRQLAQPRSGPAVPSRRATELRQFRRSGDLAQGRLLGIGLAPIVPHTIIGRVLDAKELQQWVSGAEFGREHDRPHRPPAAGAGRLEGRQEHDAHARGHAGCHARSPPRAERPGGDR